MSIDTPATFPNTGNSTWSLAPEIGMSLRDWFAGQALNGWLASWPDGSDADRESEEKVAQFSYRLGDAMLAARRTMPDPPFSSYPEDRLKLLNLARKCELSDDVNAIELGDLVRAILEDEAVAAEGKS